MTRLDPAAFLRAVLPDQGFYCMFAAKGDRKKQHFIEDIDAFDNLTRNYVGKGYETYFAMSSFKTPNNRKQTNAALTKCFWLDIDVGAGKPYDDKSTALTALKKFCSDTKLPAPSIVDSGNGLHIYWIFDTPLKLNHWAPIAGRLKAACAKYKLYADPACTSDISRILRIPDTSNFKDPNNVKPVSLLKFQPPRKPEDIIMPLQALELEVHVKRKPVRREPMDPFTAALAGNIVHEFRDIVVASMQDKGCAQLKRILLHPEDIDEPMWRAGLSIAAHCSDAEQAVHKLSKGHPNYNETETNTKVAGIGGPQYCSTFAGLNPAGCEGCEQTVSTPLHIDRKLKKAEPPTEEEVVEEAAKPVEESAAVYKVYAPYVKGENGGIYLEERDADGEVQTKLIYPYDLYPVDRVQDPIIGESALIKLHVPQDPTREFLVPASDLFRTDKGTAILQNNGVLADPKQYQGIILYLSRALQMMQRLKKAQSAAMQYGWNKENTTFVVGNKEYLNGAPATRNFPSVATCESLDNFNPKGSFEKWKEATSVYNDQRLMPQAVAFLAGFGAPLMTFVGESGAVINLISTASGTGKTTAGHAALSVWGHPKKLAMNYSDTSHSRVHVTGVMSSMPVVMDEMTNVDPNAISDLLYAVSGGRDRHRMKQHENTMRANMSEWNTIVLTSSNASMTDKVGSLKSTPEGEAMRLLEFTVPSIFIPGAEEKFELLKTNFGWAGDVYAQWLVNNTEKIPKLLRKQRAHIVLKAKTSNKERFWIDVTTSIMVGARIAHQLGLHTIDLNALEEWLIGHFFTARVTVENHTADYSDVITTYLLANVNHILAINAGEPCNISGTQVWRAPSNTLRARLEINENQLWLTKADFATYCAKNQLTESEVLRAADGVSSPYTYVGPDRKNMLANTSVKLPASYAHKFMLTQEALDIFEEDRSD